MPHCGNRKGYGPSVQVRRAGGRGTRFSYRGGPGVTIVAAVLNFVIDLTHLFCKTIGADAMAELRI